MDPKTHDELREEKIRRRAMEALKMVQEAGIDPYLNITVGHYNAKSDDLRMLLDYSKKNKYRTLVNVGSLQECGINARSNLRRGRQKTY